MRYATSRNQDPFFARLRGHHHQLERSQLFLAFAGALRQGKLHGGHPPSGTSVETTLREVAQFLVHRGLGDPRRSTVGQANLDKNFSSALKRWKDEDPAPKPQQALPSSTVRLINTEYRNSSVIKNRAIADLVTTAYFFLLRVGEYTPTTPRKGRKKRTIPLRKQDITFWKNDRVLPNSAPLHDLVTADGVTINLANQKNGHKNTQLYHSHSEDREFSPTVSLARLVHLIRDRPDDTYLGTFQDGVKWKQVSNRDIIKAVRYGAIRDDLTSRGFDLNRIGTHSLRSGGATRLKLEGRDDSLIMLLGRWSGKTFLRYIQSQFTQISAGVSAMMAPSLRLNRIGS